MSQFRDETISSSEMDHPPYAAPLPYDVYEPPETAVPPSPTQPTNQLTNQPNWWDTPINRYNLALFILVLLLLIVLWYILQIL